jgi:hypothetical protein
MYIKENKVERIWGYVNNDVKNELKAKKTYGLTELRVDFIKELLFIHNSTLHQIDIINLAKNTHEHTFAYGVTYPSMKVHKGVDLHIDRNWLILAGGDSWIIWDYQQKQVIKYQQYPTTEKIVAAQLNPHIDELWVVSEDRSILIYSIANWELTHNIPIQGSYTRPLAWHPNKAYFLFTQMEQGGSKVYLGSIHKRTIDWTPILSSTSYNLANLSFCPKGDFILLTDAGLQVYDFKQRTLVYQLNNFTEKLEKWESPTYPTSYLLATALPKETSYAGAMLVVLGVSSQMMSIRTIETGDKIGHFLPLADKGYRTKIEGICTGEQADRFYFSDYLGGIYRLDLPSKNSLK